MTGPHRRRCRMSRQPIVSFGGLALVAVTMTTGLAPPAAAQAVYGGPVSRSPTYSAGVPFSNAIPGFTPGYSPHSFGPFAARGPIQSYFPASGTAAAPFGGATVGYAPQAPVVTVPSVQYLPPFSPVGNSPAATGTAQPPASAS